MIFPNSNQESKFVVKQLGLSIERYYRFLKSTVYVLTYMLYQTIEKDKNFVPISLYIDRVVELAQPLLEEHNALLFLAGEEYLKPTHQEHSKAYSQMLNGVLKDLQITNPGDPIDFDVWKKSLRKVDAFKSITTPPDNLLVRMSMEIIVPKW